MTCIKIGLHNSIIFIELRSSAVAAVLSVFNDVFFSSKITYSFYLRFITVRAILFFHVLPTQLFYANEVKKCYRTIKQFFAV